MLRQPATLGLFLLLVCGRWMPGAEPIEVDRVWSGHPVGFSLLTHPPHQFVAYYDADRQMTIAQRLLAEPNWTRRRQPTSSLTCAIDFLAIK
jgi:hypothetical protein